MTKTLLKYIMILETDRLFLRNFAQDDFDELYTLLSDREVMQYYPAPKTKEETQKWLDGILNSYEKNGHSFWAVHLKKTKEFIGQVGILSQLVEGKKELEIGYLLNKKIWRNGYASESAEGVKNYGFNKLGFKKLISLIRPVNIPSSGVAKKIGMKKEKRIIHWGLEHDVYAIERGE